MIHIDFNLYKKFVNCLDENEKDFLGTDYTSCWMFAYYIHKKYNLPISDRDYDCIYNTCCNISEFNLQKNGLYSCYIENNTEFHHFILVVNEEMVNLLSTYGGQKTLINLFYNKYEFIHKLQELFFDKPKNKLKDYRKLFGITNKHLTKLDLSNNYFSYCWSDLL